MLLEDLETKVMQARAQGSTPKYALMSPLYYERIKAELLTGRESELTPDITGFRINLEGAGVDVIVAPCLVGVNCQVVSDPEPEFNRWMSRPRA